MATDPLAMGPFQDTDRSDLTLLYPLRLLANFIVVWSHIAAADLLGVRVGVFLFLVIMFGLATGTTRREPLPEFARRKGELLLVPWVRWSLVYLAIAVLAGELRGEGPLGRLDPRMLLYGGHPALWFLPFAAVTIVVARAVQQAVLALEPLLVAVLLALLGVATTHVATWIHLATSPELPVDAWLRCSPVVFWGVAVGQSRRSTSDARRRTLLGAVAGISLAALLVAPQPGIPGNVVAGSAVAVTLACIGFAWSPSIPAWLRTLAGFTYGIYLVHPLVAKAIATALPDLPWPLAVRVGAVWAGSALAILLLRRLRVGWREFADARSRPAEA